MRRSVVVGLALCFAGCAGVLGYVASQSRPFEHRAHVLAGVGCLDCHAGVAEAGDDDPLHLPNRGTCISCHEKPHDSGNCSDCHGQPWTESRVSDARFYLRFAHDVHVKQARGNCMSCHTEVRAEGASLLPKMGSCSRCHLHQGDLEVRNCDRCHVALEYEDSRPESHAIHDSDFTSRHASFAASARDLCASCHLDTFCAGCHGTTVPELKTRSEFDRPEMDGLHRAGFRSRHAEEARSAPGTCTGCHAVETCSSCHSERGVAAQGRRGNPHPPNWVGPLSSDNTHGPAARRDPTSCASCHSGAGEMLCVSCHKVGASGGSPHPPNWSSRLEKTRDAPCRLCHGVSP